MDKLPGIQLQNNKDVTIDLQSYQGKVILVDFWASCVHLVGANNGSLQTVQIRTVRSCWDISRYR
jgi:hypothetical protein